MLDFGLAQLGYKTYAFWILFDMATDLRSGTLWAEKLYAKLPLQKDKFSIRLLRIHPSNHDDVIRCTSIKTVLFDSEPYEALSYTWGDPTVRSTYVSTILKFG